MIAEKRTYVIIESIKDSPNIKGFDSWLCSWRDVSSVVSDYLDGVGVGEAVFLSFTIQEWTQAELEDYCEGNGIEWKG